MTQVGEATARYHKIIEGDAYADLSWAQALQESLKAQKLVSRPVSPVLRPHFVSGREYASLERAALATYSAMARAEQMALAHPQLLARFQLLPAERMLAAVEPGYKVQPMGGLLDTSLQNGSLHFSGHRDGSLASVIYSDMLADLYYDVAPVKEFRKKYKLSKLNGSKQLLQGLLKAYKEFGGKLKKPAFGIVEFRAPFQPVESSENALLAEYLRREGFAAEVVSPEQLEYRNGGLRKGDLQIDIVYRAVRVQEFLVRFDLNHPLVRAYKDRAVCMINTFRSEIATKRALFDLLTDETVTAKFPAAEKKAIRDFIPWTRMVQAAKTTYKGQSIDLPDFVMKQRAKLVLKPNDEGSDHNTFRGAEIDDLGWEKALRQAMRTPYVVQEVAEPVRAMFPLLHYGSLVMKEMQVEVHPHAFQGKIHGASSWLSLAGSAGFSTLAGMAPTFMLEGK
jgi:hypothetical protein